jgi:hypothetical protein
MKEDPILFPERPSLIVRNLIKLLVSKGIISEEEERGLLYKKTPPMEPEGDPIDTNLQPLPIEDGGPLDGA